MLFDAKNSLWLKVSTASNSDSREVLRAPHQDRSVSEHTALAVRLQQQHPRPPSQA